MKLLRNRKLVALLATLALATTAVAGYAFWTTTGSGSGSATNASANGTIVLHASFAGGLFPGGSRTVSFTADNAGASNLHVGTITTDSITTDKPLCDVADFSIDPVLSDTNVLAGASGQALAGTGTLSFANTAVNQDECKGAIVTLHLSSN
jgi:hypothetical protein